MYISDLLNDAVSNYDHIFSILKRLVNNEVENVSTEVVMTLFV